MLLRDRLISRIDEMRSRGTEPDYVVLATDVLGIRNAPPALARRLVSQALVVEDRRDAWRQAGERICADAPVGPGVYVLTDAEGQVLYVGKAVNLRRRLRTHFAERRWKGLKAPLARAAAAGWEPVGSELEALLREALLIEELRPLVNVQTGPPDAMARVVPAALFRDVVVIVPGAEPATAVLVAARPDGSWMMERATRHGVGLRPTARRLRGFFKAAVAAPSDRPRLGPIVYSWLVGRGARATRLNPADWPSAAALETGLQRLFADSALFTERLELR